MRTNLLVANWKMYKTPAQAAEFVREFLPKISNKSDEIVICPPAISIPATVTALEGSRLGAGAQNLHWEKEGAFTGEISAPMIVAAGCSHVIIGHSERRQYFGETDTTVNKKLRAALDVGLTPIVCVGELLEEREAGITDDVLRRQCSIAFREISGEQARKLTIAYEPVWAIGTGRTATPQIAAEAHATIRAEVAKALGDELAQKLCMLYGGSVKPENIVELMAEEEINGALVGGASLDPKSFAAIVNYRSAKA
ncbi:MAG: triosephosphate isomerase [Candidatus Angelobacter sp.]|jgi:triosephosphate isomerase|nr:triosephosphate isomerase [Candidatus Angelobacter sp.]